MPISTPRVVRIHYRLAKLEGVDGPTHTLQERLKRVMQSALGQDARKRIMPISDDGQHRACLNYSEIGAETFLADVMHLDGRSVLPTWMHPDAPRPVAEIIPKELGAGEASLSEPLYLLVRGNHIAAIERLGFRNTSLQRYVNALLKAAGELEDGAQWRLVPKVEITGSSALTGGVKKVVFRPRAALTGEGPSEAPARKPTRTVMRRMDDLVASGQRVIAMAVAAGADETKLETLRAQMSNDLMLRARLEISVASLRQRTTAEVHPDAVQQAFAELANEGDVAIVSEDGRTDGKLIQLVHQAEVLETGGLIDWQRVAYALTSAMAAWAAKGSIDLSQ